MVPGAGAGVGSGAGLLAMSVAVNPFGCAGGEFSTACVISAILVSVLSTIFNHISSEALIV